MFSLMFSTNLIVLAAKEGDKEFDILRFIMVNHAILSKMRNGI
jgi:hypothetical protein